VTARRRNMLAAGAAGALALAAAVALVLGIRLGAGDAAAGVELPGGQWVGARLALTPNVHLFGEQIEGRIDVALDRRHLDPDAIRVETAFAPYEQTGATEVSRRDSGHLSYLRYRYMLRCLGPDCIPPRLESAAGENETGRGERQTFRFKPARLTFPVGSGVEPRILQWSPVEVVSRINATEYAEGWSLLLPPAMVGENRFPFRGELAPPAVTYRIPPLAVAGLSLGGALLLLLVPAWAVVGAVRERRRTPAERWALLGSLERAARLSAWAAAAADEAECRRALELAAVEVDSAGRGALAEEIRALAWSDAPPSDEETARVAEAVAAEHRAMGGRHGR
jgi:hypothetical protein